MGLSEHNKYYTKGEIIMQMSENMKNQLREMAEQEAERRKEIEINPLLQYSTTQLKAELRRRKKNN